MSDYETALREWGARKLASNGYGYGNGPGRPLLAEIDRATVDVEYKNEGGSGSTLTGSWDDLGVEISGGVNGRGYWTFVDMPFVDVVREIAEVAQELAERRLQRADKPH